MRFLSTACCVVVTAIAVLVFLALPASALMRNAALTSSAVVFYGRGGVAVTFSIRLPGKPPSVVTRELPGHGGSPAPVTCNHHHDWTDSDGHFGYQHSCEGTTAPWTWQISAKVQAIIVGSVNETGMTWTRNGKLMPQQAPHVEGKNYVFHGTFNPLHNKDVLSFNDTFNFKVNVGGQEGSGQIIIWGNIHQLATS